MISLKYCQLSLDVTTVADITTAPTHTSSPTWHGAKQSFHIRIDTTVPTNHPLYCSSGPIGKHSSDLYQTDQSAYLSPSEAGSLQAPNSAANGKPTMTPNTTKYSAYIMTNTTNMMYSTHNALMAQRHNGSPAIHLFPSVFKKRATTVGSSQAPPTTSCQNPPKGLSPHSKHTASPSQNRNEKASRTSSYTHHQSISWNNLRRLRPWTRSTPQPLNS
jgi:hypothetical protein